MSEAPEGPFACHTTRACQPGWYCVDQRCQATPPGILDGGVGPDEGGGGAPEPEAPDPEPEPEDDDAGRDAATRDAGPQDGSIRLDARPVEDAAVVEDGAVLFDAAPVVDAAPEVDAAPVQPWPDPAEDPVCGPIRQVFWDGGSCDHPDPTGARCVSGTCAPWRCDRAICNDNGPTVSSPRDGFVRFEANGIVDGFRFIQGGVAGTPRTWSRRAVALGDCGATCLRRGHATCSQDERIGIRLPTIYELIELMPRGRADMQALAAAGFAPDTIDYDPNLGVFQADGALLSRTVTADGWPVHMRWRAGEAHAQITSDPLPGRVFATCTSALNVSSKTNPDVRVTALGLQAHGDDPVERPTWQEAWTNTIWVWAGTEHARPAAEGQCTAMGFRLPDFIEVWALFDGHPAGPRLRLDLPDDDAPVIWTSEVGDDGAQWTVDYVSGAVQATDRVSAWTLCVKRL